MKLKYLNKDGLEYAINKIKQYVSSNYATKDDVKTPTGDTLPIGAVLEWYSDTIPVNWLLCNGQAISRTDYAELFSLFGTKYGVGDGSTTFNLPDMRGKGPIGEDENDEDFNEIGKTGGEKKHTLTIAEMPSHSHSPSENTAVMMQNGTNEIQQVSGGRTYSFLNIGYTGGNQPHNNLQPYAVCKFIIKAKQSSGLVATVVDNLESTSETDALSAKQGKILKESIETRIITGQESLTNEFVDGKRVYVKRFASGALPNAGNIDIDAGINFNEIFIIKIEGVARDRQTGLCFPLNFANPIAASEMIGLRCTGTRTIRIYTRSRQKQFRWIYKYVLY